MRDRQAVERHLALAESNLVAAAGGGSLCRIGSGPQAAAVKHAEGGHAALRELRHLLRAPDSDVLASAVDLLATWEVARARAESQGPAWTAYREGGVMALHALVDDLANTTESTGR